MRTGLTFTLAKRILRTSVRYGLSQMLKFSKQGDLTDAQVKQVMELAEQYKEKLIKQWKNFKEGKPIRIIKIKK